MEELKLKEFAGQRCDVTIIKRENGSKFVIFESESGFGHPSLEESELKDLLEKVKNL